MLECYYFKVKVKVGGVELENLSILYCVEVPCLCLHNLAFQPEETLWVPVVFSPSLTAEFNTITAPLMAAPQVNLGAPLVLMTVGIMSPTCGDIVHQTVHLINKQPQLTTLTPLLQQPVSYLQNPLL